MDGALGWPWAAAFVATVWIEAPIIALAGRGVVSIPRAFLQSLGLQLTTHPLLWWSFGALTRRLGGYLPALVVAEAAVFLVEAALLAWLWRPHLRRALVAVLCANASSIAIGMLLMNAPRSHGSDRAPTYGMKSVVIGYLSEPVRSSLPPGERLLASGGGSSASGRGLALHAQRLPYGRSRPPLRCLVGSSARSTSA